MKLKIQVVIKVMKIKQIELKDVDLATLNENEVYYCDLNNFYIQDFYFMNR